ncbi:VVA0879 family protein [Beijerinckia sp. L45]|uniref:VVA0879 family protein n=1 Tax=Beijerinckia sp. L45 TaxID=1641855 RepID=UPI00131D0E3B|nr:VVA0879 family protein [Beijerinckia sp. L45]
MKKMLIDDARAALSAQGVSPRNMAAICPICGTIQSMASLVRAGAPKDKVEDYFAFSCEGRFTGVGPLPSEKDRSAAAKARRSQRGCDWTLGGLFSLHKLTIVYPDGKERPSFQIATAEQAQALRDELAVSA